MRFTPKGDFISFAPQLYCMSFMHTLYKIYKYMFEGVSSHLNNFSEIKTKQFDDEKWSNIWQILMYKKQMKKRFLVKIWLSQTYFSNF